MMFIQQQSNYAHSNIVNQPKWWMRHSFLITARWVSAGRVKARRVSSIARGDLLPAFVSVFRALPGQEQALAPCSSVCTWPLHLLLHRFEHGVQSIRSMSAIKSRTAFSSTWIFPTSAARVASVVLMVKSPIAV